MTASWGPPARHKSQNTIAGLTVSGLRKRFSLHCGHGTPTRSCWGVIRQAPGSKRSDTESESRLNVHYRIAAGSFESFTGHPSVDPCGIEICCSVLRSQCLDRRIASHEHLISEIGAWERQRNASGARIKWMFTTDKARTKIGRAYPTPTFKESYS